MSTESNEMRKKILDKKVQAALSDSRQKELNHKVRQVRSEYLIASAIQDEMENACTCCEFIQATVEQGDCVIAACYPNPNYRDNSTASWGERYNRKFALSAKVENLVPSNQTLKNKLAKKVALSLDVATGNFKGLVASGAINPLSTEHFAAQLERAKKRK